MEKDGKLGTREHLTAAREHLTSARDGRFEMPTGLCELLSGRCEILSGRCEMLSGSQVPGLFPSMPQTLKSDTSDPLPNLIIRNVKPVS